MITGSPHLYRRECRDRGRTDETANNAIAQTITVEQRGCAAVLTLGHLAHRTGVSYHYLRDVVERQRDPYHSFQIHRRAGRTPRLISVPNPTLMSVQRWVLDNILNHLPSHSSSYAYQKGKSIRQCASRHLGARWLVKADLHNFFHSINEKSVFEIFVKIGYSRLVALELSRLCTREASHLEYKQDERYATGPRKYVAIPQYHASELGFVPQGAPTSGALANQVARPLDEELTSIASEYGLVYTRYADDITLSGDEHFNRKHAVQALRMVGIAATRCGFEPHRKKSRIVPPGARKVVLGLLVDTDKVRLSKEVRSKITTHIRAVENFGLLAHQTARAFSSAFGLIRHIEGLLAFALDIDPSWADVMLLRWKVALTQDGWDYTELKSLAREIDATGLNAYSLTN